MAFASLERVEVPRNTIDDCRHGDVDADEAQLSAEQVAALIDGRAVPMGSPSPFRPWASALGKIFRPPVFIGRISA